MLAMPILGSQPSTPINPIVTFFGPNDVSQIIAVSSSGQEAARFIFQGDKSAFSISRIANVPNAPPLQICSGEKPSLSSTTTMNVHGQTVKLTESRVETSTVGKLRFSESFSGAWKLKDKQGVVVAQGSVEESKLEVFVPADEATLDVFLAGWVAFSQKKGGSHAKGTTAALTAFKLVGALSGMPVGN